MVSEWLAFKDQTLRKWLSARIHSYKDDAWPSRRPLVTKGAAPASNGGVR